ncbi:MAG TPA: SUMF1/EgtB/PvdO family nonheme iron enzyme [Candidatus Eisenbacteria bacterium]|nr:SUMF1/EgtB/PvdO family nonheme iron enzyme [Candidatus Eisenbacteria bacterium]
MASLGSSTVVQQLHRRILEARANTDQLFQILHEATFYERPIPERNRIVFYLGHLEAFDWNLLRDHLFALDAPEADFDKLFAFGIDPVDGGLPADQPKDWPVLPEVRRYVQSLREQIDNRLQSAAFSRTRAGEHSAETLLHVAIEHRLMHAETLAYMFHRLPHSQKYPQAQTPGAGNPVKNELVEIPAGAAILGLHREAASPFGWDNEFDAVAVKVPEFRIQKYMVTNGEFLQFLEDGGYRNRELWSPADWEWKENSAVLHPTFWQKVDGDWLYRGMFELIPLPETWPVYVSHAEATAYARWSGRFLPTEAQWHRAAYGAPQGTENDYTWGSAAPSPALGNFDFHRWDPVPVDAYPANQSALGVAGLLGNGWEWTSTRFAPFPGFEPFAFYPGYSANFFDDKHYVIKGGSSRTAACLLRRSFRNWFQPRYQYVYAGFRCASE